MNTSGKELIKIISNRLQRKNILCDDSAIINLLNTLSEQQLSEIMFLKKVILWHNEEIEKEAEKI